MDFLRAGGLTRKIYLAFLAAAVLPTAVAGFIGVWLSLDRLRAATVQGLQQEISARAGGLRLFFTTICADLQALAANPDAVALLTAAAQIRPPSIADTAAARLAATYGRWARVQPDVYQVRLLDAKGVERVRVDRQADGVRVVPASELQDKSDRYYVREALAAPAGRIYVSPLDLNVERGEVEKPERPVIRLASVVTAPGGTVVGLVIINLHAQVLIEPLQQMVQSREGTAYLFDRSGQFLARDRRYAGGGFVMRPVGEMPGVAPRVLEDLLSGAAGNLTADGLLWAHTPVEFLGDAKQTGGSRWTIAIAFPERVLLSEVVDLARLYGVLLAALLIAAIAGYSISRRLIGPLGELAREADAIASGDFRRRVRIEGRDEIATLGERFNLMAARLQATLSQLQQHRDRLEAEVVERTHDLAAERARLAAVLRHTSDAIVALRPDGALLLANRAAERLLTGTAATAADSFDAGLHRLLGDARPGREEIALNRRTLSVSRDTLPAPDGPDDLVIVVRDITEERRLLDEKREFDRQLFQMDKLATFGELAMGLAHEIGNPLAGMKAVVQSLLAEPGIAEGVAEDLRRLESEVDRLSQFLQQFRGLATPRPPELSAQPLAAAVDDMLFWIRKPARATGVCIEVSIADDTPPVCADPAQLRQVLLNLFVNALQAMPQGGRLSVTGQAHGDEVLIAVQDSGAGIPEEMQSRIFQPFFTTRPGGSGLGLSVCAKIVQDHGGRIAVQSSPGATRLLVHWPAYRGAAVAAGVGT